MHATQTGSIISPFYQSGNYYATHADPDQDSPFKAKAFLDLWHRALGERHVSVSSYADVGCGGGGAAALVAEGLRQDGHCLEEVAGYDISPHVLTLRHKEVTFYYEDFCKVDAEYDVVTLFDVMEHVPNPVDFLKGVAERCSFIGLHIPLDRSLMNCLFDRFRQRLKYPGHLIVLDTPMALNLIAMSGILALDYTYTHGYSAPSGTMTFLQRAAYPVRAFLAHVSPWLSSRIVGGVSLMIVGVTPKGLQRMQF